MSEVAQAPQLRFPEFSGEWKEKKLDSVVSKFIVPMRDKPTDLTGSIPWCRIEDFDGMYLNQSKTGQGVSEETVKEMNLKVYPINTLLVSCSANLGFCAIVKKELITNQTFIGLQSNDNLINIEFLYYLMKLSSRRLNILSSGTTISYLSRREFENFKITTPSLPEQQKIAAFLTAVDNKIEQLSKKQALLGEYKKGLMQQIFSQAIRFKANDGSDFPDWEEKKLGDLSVVISDGNYGELYPTSSDFKLTGVPFLRANNIKSLKIDGTDTKYITEEQHSLLTSGHLQTNDILITTRGVLGNLAIVESTHNGSNINAQICLLRVTNTSELNHFYLLFVLDHRDSKKQYKAFETGTALKQLPKGNLRKIKLKLPTLFEQNKIANFLSSIDTKIEQVDKQLDESKQFKKALLQQMFV